MLDTVSIDNCRLLIQTLGHSLWQASAVAVCCWLVLRSLPAKKAELRYAVTCGGLLTVVLAALVTAAAQDEELDGATVAKVVSQQAAGTTTATGESPELSTSASPNDQSSGSGSVGQVAVDEVAHDGHDTSDETQSSHAAVAEGVASTDTASRTAISDAKQSSTAALSGAAFELRWPVIVAGVWVFGVFIMLFRLVRVIVALRDLQSSLVPVDDGLLGQLRELVAELSQRMKLRWPVSLVVSEKVSMPGIVGTF